MENSHSTTQSIFNKLASLEEKEDQLLKKRESLIQYLNISKGILFFAVVMSIFFIAYTTATEGKVVLSIILSLCTSAAPTIGICSITFLIKQAEKKIDKISDRTATLLDILDKRKQRS